MTCVQGSQSQKIGSWAIGGGGTFPIPYDCGVIIVSCTDCEFGHIMSSGDRVVMRHGSHELEITVSDGSLWVCESDQGILNPRFVRLMPHVGLIVRPMG